MRRRAVFRGPAERDLLQLGRYFARQSVRLERRFLASVKRACKFLLRWPHVGSRWETDTAAYADMRVWPIQGFENYLIIYRPIPEGIEVFRVLQGSRDLERIFGPDIEEP